jgi:hypothetical protein
MLLAFMKIVQSNFMTATKRSLQLAALLAVTSVGQPYLAHSQARAELSAKPTMESRSAFATRIENQLRQSGIDARVQLDGDQRDVLRIEWWAVGRRNIRAFVDSAMVRNEARPMGFRMIVFVGGTQHWDYDLARESMIWSSSQL